MTFFLVSASLAVAVCVSGGFLAMANRERNLMWEEMRSRARRDFANIVLVRQWNAAHGGVFVEKRPGMPSSPYLEHPDIQDAGGRTYTLKTPATMTRELSEMLQPTEGYSYHITSLHPVNPSNGADESESLALKSFEAGAKERIWAQLVNGKAYARYMAPLYVDSSCLACHAKQGYRLGEVRGGISVSIEVGGTLKKLRASLLVTAGLALLTTVLLLSLIILLFTLLVRRLAKTRKQLEIMAITDPLTGLFNRRHVMRRFGEECARQQRFRHGLTCILVDADRFKRVNDRFGHLAGDEVLRQIAEQLRKTLRSYDLLGRYGGEEFLAVLSETDAATALAAAERMRAGVEEQVECPAPNGKAPKITISLGVAHWREADTVSSMLQRADEALYRAKAAGRNRVEVQE